MKGRNPTQQEEDDDNKKLKELLSKGDLFQHNYIEDVNKLERPRQILNDPNLLDIIQTELDKKIEGERDARLVVFMVMNMRKVKNLGKASDNLMVNDDAGTGKDHVVSSIYEIIPDAEKMKRERISPKVLAYLNDIKTMPEGWAGKILYLEDVPNITLNDDAFKVMSSANPNGITQTSVVSNQTLKNIDIKGKPSIILTIAVANPKDETLRRYPIVNLTSTKDQTKAILKKQSDFAMLGISEEYDPAIKKALSLLMRVPVKIPYANKLNNAFPMENVIVRTHFPRFLDYIKSSCALYQFQRKMDESGYYLANEQDYEIARKVLASTTSNSFMIPLTKLQKGILEVFAKLPEGKHTISDLDKPMQHLATGRWLRIQLEKLSEKGFVSRDNEKREDSFKPVAVYTYNKLVKLELPSFKELDSYTNNTHTTNSSNDTNSSNSIVFEVFEQSEVFSKVLKSDKNQIVFEDLLSIIMDKPDGEISITQLIELGFSDWQLEKWKGEGLIFEPREGVIKLV